MPSISEADDSGMYTHTPPWSALKARSCMTMPLETTAVTTPVTWTTVPT